jgi:hypothetical protein
MVGCLCLAIHFGSVGQLSSTAANLAHDIRFNFMLDIAYFNYLMHVVYYKI